MDPQSPDTTTILSRTNPLVRQLRQLLRSPEERRQENAYLAAGVRVVQEALDSDTRLECILVSPRLDRDERGRSLRKRLHQERARFETVSDELMAWVLGANHQGVLVQVRREEPSLEALVDPRHCPLLLIAWGVQDPGNLGGLIRVAAAAGVSGFIAMEGSADPFNLKSVRGASGALFRLPVHALSAMTGLDFLDRLRRGGYRLAGTLARGGKRYDSFAWEEPTALLVGGEGAGLPSKVIERLDERLTIPMAAGTESLNVLSAATLMLYRAAHSRKLI